MPRSIPIADRFWTKVSKTDTCWLWIGAKDDHDYGLVFVNGRNRRAHRIAYELTHGFIPKNLIIRHTCDTTSCVNPNHLVAGTQLENIADRNARNRTAKGERSGYRRHPERYPSRKGEMNGRSKLTWQQAEEIRSRYARGDIGTRPLAAQYGVSRSLVRFIIQGKNWVK